MAVFTGTAGPDLVNGTAQADEIYGFADNDVLNGNGGDDLIAAAEGDDRLSGGANDDVLWGEQGTDRVDGGSGNDVLGGGEGDDEIIGGTGSDWAYFFPEVAGVIVDLGAGTATGEGIDTLDSIENAYGGRQDDQLTGDEEGNQIRGNDGDDAIFGGAGDDWLDGGEGEDRLYGGEGNDRIFGAYFSRDTSADLIDAGDGDDHVTVGLDDEADGGAGSDTLSIDIGKRHSGVALDLSAFWTDGIVSLGAGVARGFESIDRVDLTDGPDSLIVGSGDGDGHPWVQGRGGDDRLTGGGDNEWMHGNDGSDVLTGAGGNDRLDGEGDDDRLEGGAGDDRLEGGAGLDILIGGPGSDAYNYSWPGAGPDLDDLPASDRIVEEPDEAGADRIYIDAGVQVGDAAFAGVRHVEIAELRSALDLDGPEYVLGAEFQASGIATILVSADIDASQLSAGVEFVVARTDARSLTVAGGSGDDAFRLDPYTLAASSFDYVLSGGPGFDTLHLGVAPASDDMTGAELRLAQFEAMVLGGGTDPFGRAQVFDLVLTDAMMEAGILFAIDARAVGDGDSLLLDMSQLTGGRAVRLLAGGGVDTLAGGIGDDELYGGGGNDALDGAAGADHLAGEAGDDLLRGGDGTDAMMGGSGDDIYLVDASADRIVELSGEGHDTVRSSASYTLPDHVEHLVLTGGGNINGSGNGLANTLTGNDGNNRLDGGGGADSMAGGTGHDTYVVNHAGDQVIEAGSSGNDTVESAVGFRLPTHVEKLILTGGLGYDGQGNSGANTIIGNAGGNFLNGGRGNDIIDGGAGNDGLMGNIGNDSLKGGAGEDRFYFNVAPGGANADRILDFAPAADGIYLLRSVFAKAGPDGMLSAGAFRQGTSAADAGDRIVYDQATGKIFYDADGTGAGAAILFATVTVGTPLTNADFLIYG